MMALKHGEGPYTERAENGWGILQEGDDDEELSLLVSPRVMEYLTQLVNLGLWGGTAEEVARALIARGLQGLARDRFLKLEPRDSEEHANEA